MKQWINDERTVLVRQYTNDRMEVATRPEPGDIWSPPIIVKPDPVETRSDQARR